ncbi:MAG TPA: ABC transporter permease [Chitinophagaceae bacterium]|nr:ABC transporter permease [Chitinophagaceae bacterium]
MFKTNLKIAWRNLTRDKQFTLLNVTGLAAGLACTLLIFLWVDDELSYDSFFANNERLFQLMERQTSDGKTGISDGSSGLLAEAVARQFPEVEYASPLAGPGWYPPFTLSAADKNIKALGQYAGKDYFRIFSFPLLEGNKNTVLAEKNGIAISDELAKKLFGTATGVTGRPIRLQQTSVFFVSGVFEKPPVHSSQQFDFVLSWDYFKTIQDWVTSWNNIGPQNFVLLKKGTNINAFNKKIAGIISANTGKDSRVAFATKFSGVYLHNNVGNISGSSGRIAYVKMFSLIALFILVVACINFMNLSTAKAARRLKEVGIKKVIGANRRQLIVQFLSESVLLTLAAMWLAIVIALLLLPAFNEITGKNISLRFDARIFFSFLGIVLFTGLVAGSYPALYLSKFKPLAVLKGKLPSSFAEIVSRKGLVVFQFTLSAVLIIAVIIIYQQIQFIQTTDPGFNKDNLVKIDAEGKLSGYEQQFANELKNIPGVTAASYTFTNMVGHTFGDYGLSWQGKDPARDIYFEVFGGGHDFVSTMGMHILNGRGFSEDFGTDTSSIILNEAAVKVMNLKHPVAETVHLYGHPMQVIGVVRDFHFESMHEAVKPAYILLQPHGGKIIARISAARQQQTLAAIQQRYEKENPGFSFSFNFLDEAYQRQYITEAKVSALSKYFAGLAIIISCLGLFGLAAFTAQKRSKEIGIRKVIGASVTGITAMLSKDFLKLVALSLLIAFPVSGWLMHEWLQSFAYHIPITASVFVIAGASVIFITILTIGFQSVKAAIANPVKSLRAE